MNNRFAVINFSPNLNIRRRTIKLRQLKAMFTFTTLRLHLHTIEYRMSLRGEFRLEIFQFPYWLSNPKFRPPALSFGAQKKFRSESLTVNLHGGYFKICGNKHISYIWPREFKAGLLFCTWPPVMLLEEKRKIFYAYAY